MTLDRSAPRAIRIPMEWVLSAATYANDAKDGRLKRVLAATVALLEAFDGIPRRLGCEWCPVWKLKLQGSFHSSQGDAFRRRFLDARRGETTGIRLFQL